MQLFFLYIDAMDKMGHSFYRDSSFYKERLELLIRTGRSNRIRICCRTLNKRSKKLLKEIVD